LPPKNAYYAKKELFLIIPIPGKKRLGTSLFFDGGAGFDRVQEKGTNTLRPHSLIGYRSLAPGCNSQNRLSLLDEPYWWA